MLQVGTAATSDGWVFTPALTHNSMTISGAASLCSLAEYEAEGRHELHNVTLWFHSRAGAALRDTCSAHRQDAGAGAENTLPMEL